MAHALRRRPVIGDVPRAHLGQIAQLAPGGQQVGGEVLLGAADAHAPVEASGGQEGGAPDDRRALHEGQDPMAGQPRTALADARVHHVLVDGVRSRRLPDEHLRVHEHDVGMRVEDVRGGTQRAGLVPAVVLRKRHVRRAEACDARVAPGRQRAVPAVPQASSAAPGVPPLRDLQGPGRPRA